MWNHMKSENIAGSRNFLPVHQWPSTGNRPTPSSYPLGGCETWPDQTINKPKAATMITITVAKKNLEWLTILYTFHWPKDTKFMFKQFLLIWQVSGPKSSVTTSCSKSWRSTNTNKRTRLSNLWLQGSVESLDVTQLLLSKAENFSWENLEVSWKKCIYIILLKVLWMHFYIMWNIACEVIKDPQLLIYIVVLRFQRCRQVR